LATDAGTRGSDKRTFHDSAFGQKNKAALGFGQLDYDQFYAVFSGGLGRIVTCVALVNKGNLWFTEPQGNSIGQIILQATRPSRS
jgi:hypothetical protein